jgi:hypothetical protein
VTSARAKPSGKDIDWIASGPGCLGCFPERSPQHELPAESAINLYFARHERRAELGGLTGIAQELPSPDTAKY